MRLDRSIPWVVALATTVVSAWFGHWLGWAGLVPAAGLGAGLAGWARRADRRRTAAIEALWTQWIRAAASNSRIFSTDSGVILLTQLGVFAPGDMKKS